MKHSKKHFKVADLFENVSKSAWRILWRVGIGTFDEVSILQISCHCCLYFSNASSKNLNSSSSVDSHTLW